MSLIGKILSIFNRREQWQCFGIIVLTLIGAVFEAVGISGILPLVSMLADENFISKYPQAQNLFAQVGLTEPREILLACTFGLMGFFLFKNIYMFGIAYLQMRFTYAKQNYYASALMRLYLSKPYLYHVEKNSAELIRNVVGNVQNIFSVMVVNAFSLITEIFIIVSIWVMLVYVDAFLAIIVVFFLLIVIYSLVKSIKKRLTEQGEIQQKYSLEAYKNLNQALGAVKETKVLGKEEYFANQFSLAFTAFNKANNNYNLINQLPRFCIETIIILGILILIFYKISNGQNSSQIVPILSLLALAAFRLMPSANRIVAQYNTVRFYMPSLDTVYKDFMQIKSEKIIFSDKVLKEYFFENLKIEKLEFIYPQNKEKVLKEVSFEINKGNFVGIIGESGAGKTTFVDILLGLLEPASGKITVDGVDVFQDIRSWQKILAYVPQSIYLVDGTIRENIALGEETEHIDEAMVWQALKMAELDEFVQKLPEGLATKVGERGVKLSGGQRQRIGIARALYSKPQVLILDEATSALDSQTEQNITETILKLKGQLTIIAIAHRLSTLEKCDFKVEFKDGYATVVK
ncbi:ABC transporter ATP-binding protein [Succinispira mobilis]|uniref:ABC transporter ATP-binding protein n=1 Tax=Succinispira mobilis TaxID=78120 RepID=UPI00037C5341|nr:ABC transporter ATP-binding protein [Succinispira mobilis]